MSNSLDIPEGYRLLEIGDKITETAMFFPNSFSDVSWTMVIDGARHRLGKEYVRHLVPFIDLIPIVKTDMQNILDMRHFKEA